MNYCYVSRQCDDYAQKLGMEMDKEIAFEEAVKDRVSDLISDEFNPKKRGNIMAALGALTDGQEEILTTMVNHSACTLSVMMKGWISDYWEDAAEQKAIKELSE